MAEAVHHLGLGLLHREVHEVLRISPVQDPAVVLPHLIHRVRGQGCLRLACRPRLGLLHLLLLLFGKVFLDRKADSEGFAYPGRHQAVVALALEVEVTLQHWEACVWLAPGVVDHVGVVGEGNVGLGVGLVATGCKDSAYDGNQDKQV